jgi:hypothetical protein
MDYTRWFYGWKQISQEVQNTMGMVKKNMQYIEECALTYVELIPKRKQSRKKFQCSASKDSFSDKRDPWAPLKARPS